jgi:hypothetical protein
MHIECKLKRDGGTHVLIEKTQYHFAPQDDGAHVALVENEDHQDRFLAIGEAYRLYRGEHKPDTPASTVETKLYSDGTSATGTAPLPDLSPDQQDAQTASQILLGSDQHDDSYTIHGHSYQLGDLVALAHTASGLSVEDWNSLSDDGRADLIDAELEKLQAAGAPQADEAAVRAELAAQYKAKTGNPAHRTWDIEKLRAKLAE